MPVPSNGESHSLPDHVSRNLDTLADLHAVEEQRITRHQRAIETLTTALGRPSTLYAIIGVVVVWVVGNTLAHHLHGHALDPPPYVWLQGAITLASLLTSTIVLITQNRLGRITDRRQRLDLQVNLQAEQRTAKLIALLEELRRDMPDVYNRRDSEAEAMSTTADPRTVATALENLIEATEEGTPEPEIRETAVTETRVAEPLTEDLAEPTVTPDEPTA